MKSAKTRPGQDHVVMLSQEIWEQRFGSEASIVSHSVRLNREPYTVIGVMPASFRMMGFTPEVWIPLVLNAADQTAAISYSIITRFFLAPIVGWTIRLAPGYI
ncbi:MAG: ABC transporter permease [Candidatus Sulfotelmatobacter sp.]